MTKTKCAKHERYTAETEHDETNCHIVTYWKKENVACLGENVSNITLA